MMVKICGITNLDDAVAAVEAGASALGFNFYKGSPRYVTPEAARGIIQALPGDALKIGVFVDASPETVMETAAYAGLDVVQLHGGETPAGLRVWVALSAGEPDLRARMGVSRADAFLIDTPSGAMRGGTGVTFDWAAAAGLPGRVIIAGGLDEGNVAEAIRTASPWGVDACSRLETEPGKKDHERVRRFVRAALAEEL
ncbi:MAG: phosphoribosylanthranilate isomerase [Bryobacteraceae bacterium]